MEFYKSFELDFGRFCSKTVKIKQLDRLSRYLELVPQYCGDKIDIRNYTAKIFAERPDHVVVSDDCVINEDGNIVVEITESMALLDGTVRCDIKLYEDNSMISSAVFFLNVIQSVMMSNYIYAYQCRSYSTVIRVLKSNAEYVLQSGEKLFFTLKADDIILKKELTVYDEDSGGYVLSLSSAELDIPEGDYFYNVALQTADGELKKVIRKTPFKLLGE